MMSIDAAVLKTFYASNIGLRVRSYIVPHVKAVTHDQKDMVCLGLGYSDLYLNKIFVDKNTLVYARYSDAVDLAIKTDFISNYGTLPIETNSIDRVFAIHAAEFHDEPFEVFAESERVLKSGGIMIAVIPSRSIKCDKNIANPLNSGSFLSKQLLLNHISRLDFVIEDLQSYYIFSGMLGRLFGWIFRFMCAHGVHFHVVTLRKKIYATSGPGGGTKLRIGIPKLVKNALHRHNAD